MRRVNTDTTRAHHAQQHTSARDFADLWERLRLVLLGEAVFLNLLCDGARGQVPMHVKSAVPPPQV
jgi:hypothetical protein